jgi:hypothetical protein
MLEDSHFLKRASSPWLDLPYRYIINPSFTISENEIKGYDLRLNEKWQVRRTGRNRRQSVELPSATCPSSLPFSGRTSARQAALSW